MTGTLSGKEEGGPKAAPNESARRCEVRHAAGFDHDSRRARLAGAA
jgi:hypothetical protein